MKLLWCIAVPLLAAAQTGAIEGTAVNKLTKAPVPGVRIKVTDASDSSKYYNTATDASGAYRFSDLPVGKYSPWVEQAEGFFPPDPMQQALARVRVEVKDGETAKYDVEMTPASTLRGRIYDPEGKPFSQAWIIVQPVATVRIGGGRSDAEGRFSIPLAPGRYRMQIRPLKDTDRLIPTWYPNGMDESQAVIIDVGEGVDLGGYDVRLRPAEGHKLRGVIRPIAGKPVPGVALTLGEKRVKSDEHGVFAFPVVPAGDWRLTAKVDLHEVEWQGATMVLMPNRDYDRVEIELHPPFSLDASLEGGEKDRRQGIRFQLRPPSGQNTFLTATERGGHARFDALYPGQYRPGLFGGFPGHCLKAILLGASDITGRLVDFGPGSPELKFVFATNGGQISGEVEDGAGARVSILWADRDNFVPGADSFSTACDDHGKFRFSDLRPGNYYVIAYRGRLLFDAREQIFDRGLWREAVSAKVAEGESATIKLSVTNF
jgi:hypothetical protein